MRAGRNASRQAGLNRRTGLVGLIVTGLMASVLAAAPPSVSAQTDPPPGEPAPKGDIVFVVDESGSMGPDIADVRARIGDVIAQLDDAGIDARIGVVGFTNGSRVYAPLSDDPAMITAGVGMLAANKGGTEMGFSATVTAMGDAMGFRDDAAACEVLISDEDADVTSTYPQTKADALASLRARDAGFFAAVLSSGQFDYGPQPGSLAAETLGATFDLLAFRADAGPVLEALIDDCITKIQTSQPLRVDAGDDQSMPEGSVVTLDGSATSSVQGIEDRGRYTVDARSNIFAAGQSTPTAAGGVLPVEVAAMVPGTTVTFSAASGVTYTSSSCTGTAYPPDGTGSSTSIGATGGVSGLLASDRQMLVGVFAGDDAPSAPAPVPLDFRSPRTEFEFLRPEIGQTFMIGDGLSPAGARHSFEVPPGATRLFLGLVGTNYNSFCGSYEIDIATSTGPAPITYTWELLTADGPPIQLSSTAAQDPSFAVFDDGTYQLRLSATDGAETASDETTVTVTNQNPVISAVESDAAATDGLVEITTTYSDPGPFDTHSLSIDWGDGTPTETVPVQAGGTGWGYGYAGHRYATLGTPTVTVTVIDDDGGISEPQTVTVDVGGAGQGEPNPSRPAALFAASTTDPDAIRVSGSGNSVTGLSHSNAGIRVSGSNHAFVGGTEYATTLTIQGSGSTFDPAAVQAPAGGFPFEFVWADYQPGGRAAVAAGDNYHPIPTSECKGGKWKPKSPLTVGLYSVPCGVQISGSDIAGNITITAAGDIKVSGSTDDFVPFIDGLLFFSAATGSRAVDLAGSGHRFDGAMYAPTGGIEITGSANQLGCGIMGQTARISGSDNQIAGVDCRGGSGGEGTTVSIAAPPVIVPTLDLDLNADKATALPGDTITYTNTLRNGLPDPTEPGSATLLMPELVGVDNHDTAPVTVEDVVYTFEVHDAVTGEWHTWASTDPGAPPEQRPVTLAGRPTPTAGVAYAPDGFAGTVIEPGAIGSWASAAVISLTSDQTTAILDPARVDAVRNTITITTNRPLVRKIGRFDDDPLGAIRTPPAADTTNNTIVLTRPDGDPVTFDPATLPELATLTPGASATGTATATVAQPEPAAAGETDTAYLARLDAADGQALFGAAYGTGTARVGGVFANQQLAATIVHVPILTPHLAVPTQVAAGTPIPISLTLTNTGSTTATDIAATVDVAGHGTLTLTGLPAELAPGAAATGTASIATTPDATATYATTATIAWSHPGGTPGLYGPLHPTASTVAKPPVALDVVKYDNPDIIDNGIDYVIVATNTGTNPLTAVTVVDPIDPNATLIAGTATTNTGTITSGTDPADRTVTVDIGTLAPGAQAVIAFQVDYALAAPDTTEVVNQATVTSAELGDVVSDDPSEPGTADANVTPVTPPNPGPGTGGGGPGGANNGPTLQGCVPADGATITAPTDLACTLNPRDGTTITDWTAYLIPIGGSAEEATPIATGTGPDITGQLDPTILDNGIWNITIVAEDDQNGRSILESSIIIEGQLKLGRYHITYQDLAVPVGGIPIQVLRTYDTLARNTSGDFGHGWTLDVSDFRVEVHRPLGDGGWEQYDCGVAVFIVTKCLRSHRPHYVSVTWPDGRVETFDITPGESPPAFNFLSPVKYTPRPSATSTLQPAPGDEFAMILDQANNDSNLYVPLTAERYNPDRFVLVAKDGTRYLLDRDQGLIEARDRNGNTVTIDETGVHSSLGPDITFTRDTDDRITQVTGPDGHSLTYTYTPGGNLGAVTDQNTHTTSFEYSDHALTRIVDPLGNPFQRLEYDDDGRLIAITDANNNRTPIEVDVDSRTQTVTSPDGRQITLSTFDPRGNETSSDDIFDGVSHETTFTYTSDARDLLTSRTDANGNTWTADYDPDGNLQTFTDAKSHTTTLEYDSFGNPTAMADQLGGTVAFNYDSSGNLIALTDPAGRHRTWTYDTRGRTLTHSDDLGLRRTWTYTSEGRVASMVDSLGTTTFSYDSAGRLTGEQRPEGPVTYTYDDAGRMLTMVDPSGTTTYSYDDADRVTSVAAATGTVTYTYRPDGRRQIMTTPYSTTTYGYDPAGRLTSLADTLAGTIGFTHTYGGVDTTSRPNGVTTDNTYDPAGQLTRIDHTGPSGLIDYFAYALDPNGNPTAVESTDGTETYALDDLDRLTGVTYANGDTETFTYNAAGDRTQSTSNGTPTDYTYDPAGRLQSTDGPAGTIGYAWDGNGNLTATTEGDAYTWTSRNMMAAASVGGVVQTYTYDATDSRVATDGTPWLWDRANGLPQLLNDGTNTYLPGHATIDTTTTYPLADRLGSIRIGTTPTGSIDSAADYSAYGTTRGTTGTVGPLGYTGQYTDATGLLHLRARQYDPGRGLFLAADRAFPNAPGTQGFSGYAYATDRPCSYSDPSGQSPFTEYLGRIAKAGRLAFRLKRFALGCIAGALSIPLLDAPWAFITNHPDKSFLWDPRHAGVECLAVGLGLALFTGVFPGIGA